MEFCLLLNRSSINESTLSLEIPVNNVILSNRIQIVSNHECNIKRLERN